jgi:hypothetical protein
MYRRRRSLALTVIASLLIYVIVSLTWVKEQPVNHTTKVNTGSSPVSAALKELLVKGRAPKTGYTRDQFGSGWESKAGCDTRNIILNRDLYNVVINDKCEVVSGMLNDPYTGKVISFIRGGSTSDDVQIDHVVALSDAWQKGAQQLTREERVALANDPLELLAVDGGANQQKSDGDAATWLPSNKAFRCQYVARQISVKQKYKLWVTAAEHDAMNSILEKCPDQLLPSP